MHMDATEIGAYWMLCVAHYQAGIDGLPDDDTKLARIAKVTPKVWNKIRPVMAEKFEIKDSFWRSKKVVEILLKILARSSDAKAKALKRWVTDDATALPKQYKGNANHLTIKPIEEDIESSSPPIPPKEKFVLPEWIPEEAWAGYVQSRKHMTARAKSLTVRSLDKLRQQGHDPTEVLNQSVMRGWTGVFPLKRDYDQQAPPKKDYHREKQEIAARIVAERREFQ